VEKVDGGVFAVQAGGDQHRQEHSENEDAEDIESVAAACPDRKSLCGGHGCASNYIYSDIVYHKKWDLSSR
jgi:hypothetical protein